MVFWKSHTDIAADPFMSSTVRGRLFRKYAGLFVAVVCATLTANGLLDIWFSSQGQKSLLIRVQQEQAAAAAERIGQFFREIEGQMAWATQLPWSPDTLDEWRFDAVRLLRQVPAVTEVAQLDATGHEQARMSRLAMDVVGDQADYSNAPEFMEAHRNKIYFGPVYLRHDSEPYMTLAIGGPRESYGVIVAQVNLKFIWDVVVQIKTGEHGQAYVIDDQGRLIAHPDISLVLRNPDFSRLAQVRNARAAPPANLSEETGVADDFQGRQVLTAHALVSPLNWLVFVELPIDEAYAPIYASLIRSSAFLLGALVLAVLAGLFLARRMVVPIQALRNGAARIGTGDLSQRISIKTGDELEALGDQFNNMAARLQESYATLERKIEERTRQLELANLAKSRFLATASHDLRQPLHALGLFVAQLRAKVVAAELSQVVGRIEAAVGAMNELFNDLLDISRLDAGVLTPNMTEFAMIGLLARIEATFGEPTQEKNLSMRVVPCDLRVRSDFILLERILFNLVSNAIRYTSRGGIVVGCRQRGQRVRIEVWDTGPGIPEAQRPKIFDEFYRLGEPERDRRGGLGLGLAIVDRLCKLLDHPIELSSVVGRGSRFVVIVPLASSQFEIPAVVAPPALTSNSFNGKVAFVIDDDMLVLESMSGLLRSWGLEVVTASSVSTATLRLAAYDRAPDLIISDYQLQGEDTGTEVIERLRQAFGTLIPAFLISGDTNPDLLHAVRAAGYQMLHKPVDPMKLRALLTVLLKKPAPADA